MRILLISANREKSPYPVAPIGLAYVAAALQKDGHDIDILDLCFAENIDSSLSGKTADFNPDIIGLSIRNIDNLTWPGSVFYLPEIKLVVDRLKPLNIPIVAGGSGFSLFPEAALRYLGLEFGIVGEGEAAFREFVKRFERLNRFELIEGLSDIPGLALIKNNVYHQNPISLAENFSAPSRDLLDNKRYYNLGGMANVQTKRGCPFKCIYCTYPNLDGRKIRCRDVDDIVNELEVLTDKLGCDYVFFVDDIFNQPVDHSMELCRGIVKRGIRINWTCFATPGGITPELLKLMKKAGCKGIEFGTDTASGEMLKRMRKSFAPADIRNTTRMCDTEGIETAHYLIFGGPGESEETVEETCSFMYEINPRAVIAMTGIRIYPDTELERISLAEGIINNREDILSPIFYISPLISRERLLARVRDHALSLPNWIVPGLDIKNSYETTAALRMLGHKGPLWDMLGKEGRAAVQAEG